MKEKTTPPSELTSHRKYMKANVMQWLKDNNYNASTILQDDAMGFEIAVIVSSYTINIIVPMHDDLDCVQMDSFMQINKVEKRL